MRLLVSATRGISPLLQKTFCELAAASRLTASAGSEHENIELVPGCKGHVAEKSNNQNPDDESSPDDCEEIKLPIFIVAWFFNRRLRGRRLRPSETRTHSYREHKGVKREERR